MPAADLGVRRPTDVVVTGLGAVTPFGWGVEPLWDGIRRGVTAVRPFTRFDASRASHAPRRGSPGRKRRAAILQPPLHRRPLRRRRPPARPWRRPRSTFARCRERTGVFFGSSAGGMLEGEWFYEAHIHRGARHARRGLVASQQFNGPGDAVARSIGACGQVETISSACASAAMAIGNALRALRRGDVDVALAGGSDALCQLTYAGFNALRSVDEAASRPFRKDRLGLSLGEGAGVLVLESAEHAKRRGAEPIAILAGEASTCDAHHMTAPQPDGSGAAEAIRLALADAGSRPATSTSSTRTARDAAQRRRRGGGVDGRVRRPRPLDPGDVDEGVDRASARIGRGGRGGRHRARASRGVRSTRCRTPACATPKSDSISCSAVPRAIPVAGCAISTSLAFGGANAVLVFTRKVARLMRPAAVITGLGVVGPHGIGRASLAGRAPRRPSARLGDRPLRPVTTRRAPRVSPRSFPGRSRALAAAERSAAAERALPIRRRGGADGRRRRAVSRPSSGVASRWSWRPRSARCSSPRSSCIRSSTRGPSRRSRSTSPSASRMPPRRASRSRSAREAPT